MAGILSATQTQIEAARKAVAAVKLELEQISQGPLPPGAKLSARQAARVDAKIDTLVAAIAPLNT